MKIKKTILKLPNNIQLNADVIEYTTKKDKKSLYKIYKDWKNLSDNLKTISGRGINIPEGLSEGAFCIEMNCIKPIKFKKLKGINTSFDVYDESTFERIQVKACSVIPDLTSFGPKSIWDKIYFLDFYRNGAWDGKFDIYLIPNNLVYSQQINATQTFSQVQSSGKRPRFSIMEKIIQAHSLTPIKTGDLTK